jgi:hypothetical protein
MATPYLQTEDIAWAVRDALATYLPGELAEVESRRNGQGRMAVGLLPPVRLTFGFDVEAMDAAMDQFPMVSFVAAPRQPATVDTDQRMARATHGMTLEWMVLGDSRDEATVIAWRYGEAILQVLMNRGPFAGFIPETIFPPIQEGQPLEYDGQGVSTLTQKKYLGAGQLTLPLRGSYVF